MIGENKAFIEKNENLNEDFKIRYKKKGKFEPINDINTEENTLFNFPFQIDKTNAPSNGIISNNKSNRKSIRTSNLPL